MMRPDLEKSYDKNLVTSRMAGIFGVCVFLFLLFLFWWNQRIPPVDVSNCRQDAGHLTYECTKTYGSGYVQLEGYAYVPGADITYAKTTVLIYNPADDTYYALPTGCVKMTDVTKNANDGYNYDYCGFKSVVLSNKIRYGTRFYIRCQNNGDDILLDTGQEFNY